MMNRKRRKTDRGSTSRPADPLELLQERIGYRFRNIELLQDALTHPSYINEHPEDGSDNQRLEFLGDAVLGFAVATWVFERYPMFQEGGMTRLRAALVREETLARFALKLGFGEVLRLGHGEEEGGGRKRPANLADSFEAVLGAICLDGGLGPVQQLLHRLIEPAAEAILANQLDRDAKSQLQERIQGQLGVTPRYRIVAETGPDHAKLFAAEVVIGNQVAGRGEGHSKQEAEQAAAQEALAADEL